MKPFAEMTLGELLLAFEKDPQSPDVNYAIGRKLMALEKYKVSIEYFQTCIALKPKFPEAYLALAELFEKTGEQSTANGFRAAAEKLFQEIDREKASHRTAPEKTTPGNNAVITDQRTPRTSKTRDISATELLELPPPEPDESTYSSHAAAASSNLQTIVSQPEDKPLFDTPVSPRDESETQDQKRWYYQFAGEEQGPVTIEELRGQAQSGDIHRDTLIWRMGFPAWQRASDVDEMRPVLHVRPRSIPELLQPAPVQPVQKPAAPARVPAAPRIAERMIQAAPEAPASEPDIKPDSLSEPLPGDRESEPEPSTPQMSPQMPGTPVPEPPPAADSNAQPIASEPEAVTGPMTPETPRHSDPQDTTTDSVAPAMTAVLETPEPSVIEKSETPALAVSDMAVPESSPIVDESVYEPEAPETRGVPGSSEPSSQLEYAGTTTPEQIEQKKVTPTGYDRGGFKSTSDLLSAEKITFEDLLPQSTKRAQKRKPPHEKREQATSAPDEILGTRIEPVEDDWTEAAQPAPRHKPARSVPQAGAYRKIMNAAATMAAIALVAMILVRAWGWYKDRNSMAPTPPSRIVEQYIDALHQQDRSGMEATFTSEKAEAARNQDQKRQSYVASDFVTQAAISPDMRFTIRDVQKKSGHAVVQGVITAPNTPEINMKFVLVLEDGRWKIQFVDETIQGALSF